MKSNFVTACCLLCLIGLAVGLIGLTISASQDQVNVTAVASHDWYYKPRDDGGQPIVADDADFLANYPHLSMGDPNQNYLYLTFDCGYDNGYTAAILDTLKEKNVKAAFFVTGHFLDSNPDLVKRMAAEGHLVCNHSDTHKDLSEVTSPQVFLQEIQGLAEKYQQLTGQPMPRYIRPPEGKYSEEFLKLCQQYDYLPVFWSFAYKDWLNDAQPDHAQAMDTILTRTHPGEIALLHSTSATNAAILGDVIDSWREKGYTIRTLDDLSAEVYPEFFAAAQKNGEA